MAISHSNLNTVDRKVPLGEGRHLFCQIRSTVLAPWLHNQTAEPVVCSQKTTPKPSRAASGQS